MKYKYILASAFSLAVVGASIISPFSFAYLFDDEINKYQQIYQSYEVLIDYQKSIYDTITGNAASLSLHDNQGRAYYFTGKYQFDTYGRNSYGDYVSFYIDGGFLYNDVSYPSKNYFVMNFDGNSPFSILWNNTRYYFDEQTGWNPAEVDYISLPDDGSISQLTNWKLKTPNMVTSPNSPTSILTDNIIKSIDPIKPPAPTEPPNTTPAPGFPNLPDLWVNGDGNTYNIDLPDFDFNIDLPSYTMPEAVSIPADIVQKSSALYQIPLNIIDRYGLWWLVGLALICTVITLILNR